MVKFAVTVFVHMVTFTIAIIASEAVINKWVPEEDNPRK